MALSTRRPVPRTGMKIVVCLAIALGLALLPILATQAQDKDKEKDKAGEKGGDKGGPDIVQTLKGHGDMVYSVAFSEDGKFLASASFDNTVKLWEVDTGKEIKTFGGPQGHTKQVLTVSLSPDGQLIASGGVDNTLKLWDVPLRTPLRNIAATEAATAVALSPDGTKLAFASKDGLVKILNAADGKELFKLPGHEGAVTGLTFSPNNLTLVSSGADRTVRFWNVANGQAIAAVGAHTGAANAVAFLPNAANVLSVGDDGQLKFWLPAPAASRPLPAHAAAIHALALSADGNTLITASADKTVKQTLTAGKEVRALTGPAAAVKSVALHPQNTFIAAGTADSRLFLWNAADGKPAGLNLAHDGAVTGVAFNPAGNQIATTGDDGLVKLWAFPSTPPRPLAHPEAVLAAVVSPDGKKLFTGSSDKILRAWDLGKLAIERQYPGHAGPVSAVAASATGVLASGGGEGVIRFWNQATGKEAETIGAHAANITSLAFNPPANQLLSSGDDGFIRLWQVPVPAPKVLAHGDAVTTLAVSADGAKAVTGSADKIVRLWNLATAAKERDFPGPTMAISALALSADGTRIAAGSAEKVLFLWTTADAKVVQKMPVPADIKAVAFSPDGKFLAAGLADNTIKLLNPADGKDIKTLAGQKGPITALFFNPKGDTLFSASADKTVQAWNPIDGAAKTKFDAAGPIAALALSKDGNILAALADKTVHLWNANDGKETGKLTLPYEAKSLALSPDNQRLAIGGGDKLTRLLELNGSLVETFSHDGPVLALAFADAKRLVTGSADKSARVFASSLLWQKNLGGPVKQAIFSPKADLVFAATNDKAVKVFISGDGKDARALNTHEGPVVALALTADAAKLITAGADKTIKIWNLAAKPGSPEEAKPLAAFTLKTPVTALTLSPNGARLAVSETEGNLVRVFDLNLNREVQTLAEHGGSVTGLAFLGDNRTLITGSADKNARLLDVSVLAILDAHPGGALGVQYHSNGTQILTAGKDKNVKLWDLAKNNLIKAFPVPDPIAGFAFSRDFTLAGVAAGKFARIINLADGKELFALAHPADVLSVSFNADKTRLATGAADKQSRLWDLASARELEFFKQDDPVEALAFDAKGTFIVSAGGKTPRVDTPAIAKVIVDKGPLYALTVIPAGTHAITGGVDKSAKLWNLATNKDERAFPAGDVIKAVAINKAAQLVAISGNEPIVRVFNFADGKELGTAKVGGSVSALTFSPNNLVLAAAAADKTLYTWGVPFTPGQPLIPDFLKTVQNFQAPDLIKDLTVSPDNALIYSAGQDKNVGVWKLASPNPVASFPHPNTVDAVAFHPKGGMVASGGHDGKIRLFDLAKKAQLREITAHTEKTGGAQIYTVAFTPDGSQVLSASFDNTLKLWDVNTGNMVREFKGYKVKDFEKGHQEGVFSAAFSPDGKFLASGSGGLERVIKIWNVGDGSVVRDLPNPDIKTPPGQPVASHPGWIYNLRYTRDGKYLVSVGNAPPSKGFLAVWNPQDGKMLAAETLPLGAFFGLDIAPNGQLIAIGAGPRGGSAAADLNNAYLIRMPVK